MKSINIQINQVISLYETLGKDIEIRKYLEKKLSNAGIAKVEIERNAKKCEVVGNHKGKKYLVNRLKGLGEMSPDETSILVDPDQRIIKQVTVEDVAAANKLFDDLMGTQIIPRKRFIQQHSQEATYGV